jgi:hypothetical protein
VVKVRTITNTTTAGQAGTWKISLDAKHAGNLPIGNVQIVATVSDAAGNTATATPTFQNR